MCVGIMTACEYYGHPAFVRAARQEEGAAQELTKDPPVLHEYIDAAYIDTKTTLGKLETFFVT